MKIGWKFNEESTRNCVHAKVQGGAVHCDQGYRLGVHKYDITLNSVIGTAKFAPGCEHCKSFEHDEAI